MAYTTPIKFRPQSDTKFSSNIQRIAHRVPLPYHVKIRENY